jgi:hypothetical protein
MGPSLLMLDIHAAEIIRERRADGDRERLAAQLPRPAAPPLHVVVRRRLAASLYALAAILEASDAPTLRDKWSS